MENMNDKADTSEHITRDEASDGCGRFWLTPTDLHGLLKSYNLTTDEVVIALDGAVNGGRELRLPRKMVRRVGHPSVLEREQAHPSTPQALANTCPRCRRPANLGCVSTHDGGYMRGVHAERADA